MPHSLAIFTKDHTNDVAIQDGEVGELSADDGCSACFSIDDFEITIFAWTAEQSEKIGAMLENVGHRMQLHAIQVRHSQEQAHEDHPAGDLWRN
jgi:hypothetical protein